MSNPTPGIYLLPNEQGDLSDPFPRVRLRVDGGWWRPATSGGVEDADDEWLLLNDEYPDAVRILPR